MDFRANKQSEDIDPNHPIFKETYCEEDKETFNIVSTLKKKLNVIYAAVVDIKAIIVEQSSQLIMP